jgi:hypothetical protein
MIQAEQAAQAPLLHVVGRVREESALRLGRQGLDRLGASRRDDVPRRGWQDWGLKETWSSPSDCSRPQVLRAYCPEYSRIKH